MEGVHDKPILKKKGLPKVGGGGGGGGGTWTVCRLNVSGGLARKSGVVFLSGVDTPVHTMLKEKDHITIKINGEISIILACRKLGLFGPIQHKAKLPSSQVTVIMRLLDLTNVKCTKFLFVMYFIVTLRKRY